MSQVFPNYRNHNYRSLITHELKFIT